MAIMILCVEQQLGNNMKSKCCLGHKWIYFTNKHNQPRYKRKCTQCHITEERTAFDCIMDRIIWNRIK